MESLDWRISEVFKGEAQLEAQNEGDNCQTRGCGAYPG